jgi:hypothetical protein
VETTLLPTSQKQLQPEALQAYYTDAVTDDQVQHFLDLSKAFHLDRPIKVVDLGGGFGHFAQRLEEAGGVSVRVVDTDVASIKACHDRGLSDARLGDALSPPILGDEHVASFNLVLHHLVGDSLASTHKLQAQALKAWRDHIDYVFIHEYVYESHLFPDLAGKLTYAITSNKVLSWIASRISRLPMFKALRANTFGVGVRFRSNASWRALFEECGYEVVGFAPGPFESMPLARQLLFAKSKRRDSYVLKPRQA